jgi:flagellar motor protein MotB
MQQSGVRADQGMQIRGYADEQRRKGSNPEDASNRRISLIIEYTIKDAGK